MAEDKPDIEIELTYMGTHPDLFTKTEMASLLVESAEIIRTLRTLLRVKQEIELEDAKPKGHA